MPRVVRNPLHAGSWYEDEDRTLGSQIDGWLDDVKPVANPAARAIIAPHAGYRFCGHVMAHAYKHIRPETTKTIFLLGPSHHVYSRKCILSSATHYQTPLGDIEINQSIYKELLDTQLFDVMGLDVDEAEHSLELHTPYIVRIMGNQPFTLVPIMVGSLSVESEQVYGAALSRYLSDPSTVFIISSDFCHWGSRFSYQLYDKSRGPVWKYIDWLDHEGMKAIETGEPEVFTSYLAQYRNTICGRHPISVFLNMLANCDHPHRVEFKSYDQSSKCSSMRDSSVSYAAAVVTAAS